MDFYTEINNKFFKVANLLSEDVRGEWWIDDSGNAVFADGDSGDINHEGYVINILTNDLLERLGIKVKDEYETLADHKDEIENILKGEEYENIPLFQDKIKYFLQNNFKDEFKDEKKSKLYVDIILGKTNIDAREYALKYWGWKRMKGNEIETQNISDEDLKIISRGISDAYPELEDENELFNIDVLSSRTYYRDVPINIIDEHVAGRLNYYK